MPAYDRLYILRMVHEVKKAITHISVVTGFSAWYGMN